MKDSQKYIIGADIGGSHITVSVVDTEKKEILEVSYVRMSLNSNGPLNDVLNVWANAIQTSIQLSKKDVSKIAMAIPGPFNYTEGISYIKDQGKYENLYNINVKNKLAEILNIPKENFYFDNDAACFLKGEIFANNYSKEENCLGITLGTGLGSVISTEGFIQDAELWCSDFKGKKAEEYISTRWFIDRYKELSGDFIGSVKLIRSDGKPNLVAQVFEEFGNNLNEFLSIQVEKFNPKQIIIGGNIAKASTFFMPYLKNIKVPIKTTTLGENSALIGAVSNFI